MTTESQTPREVVEAFLREMDEVGNEYSERINTALVQSKAANRAWGRKRTDENEKRKNVADTNFSTILKEYRSAQEEILKNLGMKIPSDFFAYLPTGNIFRDKVVVDEKTINSNKVKVFAEIESTPNEANSFTLFVLEKVDGKWIIAKIREYNGNTKKESPILW